MTTQLLDSSIGYDRITKDYAVYIAGELFGYAANFSDAEALRTQALAERRDEGAYASASALDDTDEPGPAGPSPNDDVPNPMDYDKRTDEANRLAALYLLSRGIDACTVCGGAHRPTQCPDVATERRAQVDNLPNPGRAIYRQWHRDPQRFLRALRELDPVCWWVLAEAYAAYRHMSVQQALDTWLLAVQGTQQVPADYKGDLVLA